MKCVIPEIISPEQCGFIKDRDICESLRTALETIDYTKKNGKEPILISIDFEKCFDRVEHQSVLGPMEYFGFGQKFIDWVRIFFKNFMVCNQNFGEISNFYNKTHGVNQGCNISLCVM